MAKALVIYHKNCDDGFGAAYAFWLYAAQHYEEVKYHPASYGEAPPEVDSNTEVFILDFSYAPSVFVALAEKARLVLVLDHHKTAYEAWCNSDESCHCLTNLTVNFNMTKSGAMLAYEYFRPTKSWADRDTFFEFLQDRDLWQFKNPDTRNFTQYLRSFPQDFKVWDKIAQDVCVMGPDRYDQVILSGESIQRRFDQMCKEIIGAGRQNIVLVVDGEKFEGLCVNSSHIFASDIGNILAEESGSFGATYYINSRAELCFSVRSIGDFDVSSIAKHFGGGGHNNASGFKFPRHAIPDKDTLWIEPLEE